MAPPAALQEDIDGYCGDSLIGVSIAIAVVQTIVVAARFYTRLMQRVKCGLDDYLIILALMASIGQSVLYVLLVELGTIGRHVAYVAQRPEKLVILQKGLYANQILDFPFTVAPAKLSILLFFIRIFDFTKFKILAYVVGALVLGHGIGVLLSAIFQCSPIAYTWDKTIVGGSCFDQEAFYRYVSPPNILTDVLILLMPLPFVWGLHTRLGQKLALTGVFLLGSLGIVFSILRMTTFFQHNAMTDPTWVSVDLGIWTILESGTIIIAACLPPSWPLLSRMFPRQLLTKTSKYPNLPSCSGRRQNVLGGQRYSPFGESCERATWSESQVDSESGTLDGHTEGVSLKKSISWVREL
ncbi:hypothetical protein MAP00_004140 [Monascus purpureus]|nr:hypothetical protein MAP00_004140 [Monascus purpureus]